MIDREDFELALKQDKRKPASADVLYTGQAKYVAYKAQDFDKIRFPVRNVTLQYDAGSGSAIYVGNGDWARKDRKKVRS